jgi:mRNA interferase YafQ
MNVRYRSPFKKDYKLMMRQSRNIGDLDFVILELAAPRPLDKSYRSHALTGNYAGYRECHIEPNWLFIYGYETLDDGERQLLCVRTGTHSELLDM